MKLSFNLNLTKRSKLELISKLNYSRNKGDFREYTRIQSILLFAIGNLPNEIAKILNIAISSVYQNMKNYLLKGIKGLISKKISGRKSKLTKKQRKKLAKMIDKGPEKCGFPSSCWRAPMIQEIIFDEFGVIYNVHYISQLLDNMGYSYQKAKFVAANQDEEKRAEWLKNTWPEILKKANEKSSYILFGDEASFPQWGTLNYTWSKKGHQPVVKTSGNRKAYKVFGLIDYFTGKFFAKGKLGKLNSDTYIEFLKEVLSKTRKHVFLIQDGAKYHKSSMVKQFFEKHKNRLTVYTLPPYSPDFNPIEMLWKKIKQHGTHLKYFPTFEKLVSKVEEILIDFRNAPKEVLSLFGFYKNKEAEIMN